jgi:NADH-quinone oxidoreductase subunit J
MQPALTNPLLQIVLAAILGGAGLYLLLPKPKFRWVSGGIALTLAGIGVLGLFLWTRFGQPMLSSTGDGFDPIASALFWFFATGATSFGIVLVTQRNPARGAIAFAFVIISTCGLFLLLAAPFLMAATIIIYAGAIIVTFLFVLMLSHVKGPSDENDRTREPLLGSLAGFAFVGLLLFTLHLSSPNATPAAANESLDPLLPTSPLDQNDRRLLTNAIRQCDEALAVTDWNGFKEPATQAISSLDSFFAPADRMPVEERTRLSAADPKVSLFRKQTEMLAERKSDVRPLLGALKNETEARKAVQALRNELVVYSGNGKLPARNVANIGFMLYSEHLLAVEMAGTLLLVATIGAVAIARRKGVPA